MSGGITLTVPERDRYLLPRSYFIDRIAVGLGGRVAEELVFGDISNGASDDIQTITRMARAMVTKYGMSKKIGPIQIGSQEENHFLGRELTQKRDYSEEVAEALDREIQMIVKEQHDRVRNILRIHRLRLDAVAEALLVRETLEEPEFVDVFEGNVGSDQLSDPLALQPA